MTKRVKPNAEHRIVEGDVVTESIDEKIDRGRQYSKAKKDDSGEYETGFESNVELDPESILKDLDPKAVVSEMATPSFLARHINTILWLSLFTIVILVLYLTRPDTDWQIQKINELQQDVMGLEKQKQSLNQQIFDIKSNQSAAIEAEIKKLVTEFSKEGEAGLSQLEFAALKQELSTKLTDLEKQFVDLNAKTNEQVQLITQDLMASSGSTESNTSALSLEKMTSVENSVKQQLTLFSEKLAELSEFKASQLSEANKVQPSAVIEPLNSLQIQQWIVELNTQWMIHGRIQQARMQLLSLEQAATLSNFSFLNQLLRLIGQDLAYLDQLETAGFSAEMPKVDALRARLNGLVSDQILVSKASTSTSEASSGETSSFDKLMQGFDKLITVKKRDSEQQMLQVNKLLLNDVLKQRLALLIDRLQWGMASHSKALVTTAVNDIKAFIRQYYANETTAFNELLVPFEQLTFVNKQPLSIMRLDEAVE